MGELLINPDALVDNRTPYPNNGTVFIDDKGELYPWQVINNGVLITLINNDPQLNENWIGILSERVVERAPVVSNLFSYHKDGPEKTVGMPTVSTAKSAQDAIYNGIETAGISPYQTNAYQTLINGRTPLGLFLYLLCEAKKLPFSYDPNTYPHDLLIHWLSSAAQEKQSFGVFQGLYRQSDNIGEEFGNKAREEYLKSLGQGYDLSTGTIIKKMHENPTDASDYPFLLGKTITSIERNCRSEYPQIFEQSRRFIEKSGFGLPVITPESGIAYSVPEEHKLGKVHYRKVNQALHQEPLQLFERVTSR